MPLVWAALLALCGGRRGLSSQDDLAKRRALFNSYAVSGSRRTFVGNGKHADYIVVPHSLLMSVCMRAVCPIITGVDSLSSFKTKLLRITLELD
eukprot:4943071-Pyramimonas_sp.AAC.1